MRLRLKVCGMREPGNIREVAEVRPDYLGFIFYPASPRYVGEDFEMPEVDSRITKVGVFVNETTDRLLAKAIEYDLPAVQLHANESPEQCRNIRSHNIQIIKAFSIGISIDFTQLERYINDVDLFLFDTKATMGQHGGTGKRFDWDLLKDYDLPVPFFLSGGIREEHVAEIRQLQIPMLYGIDINSGVETAPAMKDAAMIKRIKQSLT